MVQTQLLEVTREVAAYDFPDPWTSLLPEALATLQGGDAALMRGSLLVLRKVVSQLEFSSGERAKTMQVCSACSRAVRRNCQSGGCKGPKAQRCTVDLQRELLRGGR